VSDAPKTYADKLLALSVTLLVSTIALSWAWRLVVPLLPILAFVFVVYGYLRWQHRR